jgi:serine/threonine protein kinase
MVDSILGDIPPLLRFHDVDVVVSDVIGRGAFGRVHKGTLHGLDVAVKVGLHVSTPNTPVFPVMFCGCPQAFHAIQDMELYCITPGSDEEGVIISDVLKEARILAALHHANIIAFRGLVVDTARGTPKYILTELVQCNLQQYLKEASGGTSVDVLKQACKGVLGGLAYLHSLGIVHRGICSANLLVLLTSTGFCIKIGGFSSWCMAGNTDGAGALFYAAPEVLSHQPITGTADVFSFAVSLAEIITTFLLGKPCSPSESREGMFAEVIGELHSRKADELATLLEACIVLDPASRITSLNALQLLSAEE